MFNFNLQSNSMCNNQNQISGNMLSDKDFETLQNARKDLVGELDAIIQYDDHLHRTDNKIAKETWENIRNEEITHVGELLGLIFYLAPYQKAFVEQGLAEFNDRLQSR